MGGDEREESCDGSLYEDQDFPSDDSSVFCDRSTPISRLQGHITWLRPQEICQSPVFFPDNIYQSHAKQGLLGDCWFLCACSMLIRNKHLLDKVFPAQQPLWSDSGYRGSFHFNFWQNGLWTEVTIDDRLPCVDSALCFSHCNGPSAFWVALLEKAYANGAGWRTLDSSEALALQARVSQGEFWLDETEFLSQFDDVTIGYPISEEGNLLSIYTGNALPYCYQLPGRWVKGLSCGGSRNSRGYLDNPKFWLKMCNRGEVLISLLQYRKWKKMEDQLADRRSGNDMRPQHYHAIALHMWKVEKKRFNLNRTVNKPPCASTHCHAHQREVVLHGQLDPGHYLLIPSSYQLGAEGSFLIRVFSSSASSLSALKSLAPSLPSTTEGEWETTYFQGSWTKGSSAGGSRNFSSHQQNPCFPFTIYDEPAAMAGANVNVTLSQICNDADLHPIGFHIYKVPAGELSQTIPSEDPVASCVPHCYTQDVTMACSLPARAYLIVPSTYEPNCTGAFTICLARRIQRRVVKSQEKLGRTIQEVTHISVMQSQLS
ncbi:calpain-10 isoform X2 [Nerophis ophidion]|uniref:calpain-10 isoform X2 n=1 Tax=Nerophis ophidion TaxID=159077 RepID=UPI002ADFC8B3|nr:calpain-10 isoform X2 [Nerophis ophidion]